MNIFRKKGFKIFFVIFTAFFLGVFGFGAFSFFGDNQNIIASVGNNKIKSRDFFSLYELLTSRARQENRPQTPELASSIRNQALNQLIAQNVINLDAKSIGLAISDNEISDVIRESGNFNSPDGEFDVAKYQEYLQTRRTTASVFEADTRRDLLQQKYTRLFAPVAQISSELQNYYESKFNRAATISYFTVPLSLLEKDFKADEKTIKQFYEDNKANFVYPSSYSVDLLEINKEDFIKNLEISEQEIQEYYNQNKQEFSNNASFKSSHILFSLENAIDPREIKQKADKIYKQLNKTNFAKLAEKHSDDPGSKEQEGSLGWVEYGDFVKEFEDKVKEMKVGEISKPFLSQFGYHIVFLEDKKDAQETELTEVKNKIKETIADNRFNQFLASLYRRTQKDTNFAQIAQTYQLPYIQDFLINQDASINNINLDPVYANLNQKNPDYVDIYTENQEYYVLYRLNNAIPGAIKPYQVAKKEVETTINRNESVKEINAKLAELIKEYTTDKDFDKLSKEWKIKDTETTKIYYNRRGDDDSLIASFRDTIFRLADNTMQFIKHQEKVYAVLVKEFTQSSEEELTEAEANQLFSKDYLENIRYSALINKIIGYQIREKDISYNNTLLNQLDIQSRR